ncbi:MAG TPA: tyrosine-type recombinase/integrase [Acidimicrobiales bacterium]|nr:tyrosine-type recombinase/integrase [Acidimicrobiales bacterium]
MRLLGCFLWVSTSGQEDGESGIGRSGPSDEVFDGIDTVLGGVEPVYNACDRAGIPRVGAHTLRHSAATDMLRAGGSLPEIGQVLRHRRPGTTAIYVKVDLDALGALARPWPGGVA